MQFFNVLAILSAAALVSASPAMRNLNARSGDVCPDGLYSDPLCCAVDVLGVADLECSAVPGAYSTVDQAQALCATEGKEIMCCVLPVLGQALLCESP